MNIFKIRRQKKEIECSWKDFCITCDDITDKKDTCESCSHYLFIDSGYGWCKFNPNPLLVGWCRDACYQYKRRK